MPRKSPTKLDVKSLSKKIQSLIEDDNLLANTPIIAKDGNTIRVNDLVVVKDNGFYKVRKGYRVLGEFMLRNWALAFALSEVIKDPELSDLLPRYDNVVRKYVEDTAMYKRAIARAEQTDDDVKRSIYYARLSRSEGEFETLLAEVKQRIKTQLIA